MAAEIDGCESAAAAAVYLDCCRCPYYTGVALGLWRTGKNGRLLAWYQSAVVQKQDDGRIIWALADSQKEQTLQSRREWSKESCVCTHTKYN